MVCSELKLPWPSPCHFWFRLRRKFFSCAWTPTGQSAGMSLWLLGALPGVISKSPTYLAHLESGPGHHKGSQPTLSFSFTPSLCSSLPSPAASTPLHAQTTPCGSKSHHIYLLASGSLGLWSHQPAWVVSRPAACTPQPLLIWDLKSSPDFMKTFTFIIK